MKYLLVLILALIAASFIFSTVMAVAWKLAGILVTALVILVGYWIIERKYKKTRT